MTTNNKSNFRDSCLIPIVIGITGHRDPQDADIPRLKSEVEKLFKTIYEKYKPTPLILLSLMAEGADRLVTEVALDLQANKFPIRLIVPLPLPKEEYKKDFETQESKTYFDNILARKNVIHFELPPIKDDTIAMISNHDELRNEHYFAGGRFVVEHCQILIALWDGKHNNKTGGTSNVVEMQLDGDIVGGGRTKNLFSPLSTGLVYHLITRRKSQSSVDMLRTDIEYLEKHIDKKKHKLHSEPFGLNTLYPFNEMTSKLLINEKENVLNHIKDYNYDLNNNTEKLKNKFSSATRDLMPAEGYCHPELEVFKSYYACSTTIAIEYKEKVTNLLNFIAYSMPLTVLSFEYYSNKIVSHFFWILYAFLAGSAYLYDGLSKRNRNHDKFLDYRALAEGLRVHFYWKIAGINESAATFYLSKHLSELEWIRLAISNIDLLLLKQSKSDIKQKIDYKTYIGSKFEEGIKCASKEWVNGQEEYFKKSINRQKKVHDSTKKWAKIIFLFGMFIATPGLLINHSLYPGEHADHWFHVIVPVIFVIAGAIKYYNEKMLYEQSINQYQRMLGTFSLASKRLKNISESPSNSQDKVKESQKILGFLGKEALAENGDWLLMHRNQPVEVPPK